MLLSIVIPCYNEEEALPYTVAKIQPILERLLKKKLVETLPRLYLVDDGSRDGTWSVIESLAKKTGNVIGLKLSRNCGHQNALLAGLHAAEGDAVISIDADLQDDIEIFDEMVTRYSEGHEVVYAVRSDRNKDRPFKRRSAKLFYAVMEKLGVDIVPNHADFRLLGRRALTALKDFPEVNLFLRGIVPLLGFPSCTVSYVRGARVAGESKYPFQQMVGFAVNGITSFSVVPLRIIAFLGIFLFFLSMALTIWILLVKFVWESAIPGWTSIVIPITLFGGLQLFSLGIVGEYVGKIYQEVKSRPKYILEKKTGDL